MDVLPPWKSQGRQEKVKRIMASVPELFMQEAMGIVVSSRHGVFSKIQTENMAAGLRAKTELGPVRVNREDPIFISVDPTGGGASKMALVSFAVREGVYITVSNPGYPSQSMRDVQSTTKSWTSVTCLFAPMRWLPRAS
tara:strand:+ start:1697 stop:2113 length:417 start_codon:yes stop_codon:yes gene_type:complete